MFLRLNDIKDDDLEHIYEMFGNNAKLANSSQNMCNKTCLNRNCKDCDLEACDEYRFGHYCVAAVKRYYDENEYITTIKDGYVTFMVHYNQALDWHSFATNTHYKLRYTKISRAPKCMRDGSLKFACQWLKCKIENGPHKEWYNQQRKKKIQLKKEEVAKKQADKQFRYT